MENSAVHDVEEQYMLNSNGNTAHDETMERSSLEFDGNDVNSQIFDTESKEENISNIPDSSSMPTSRLKKIQKKQYAVSVRWEREMEEQADEKYCKGGICGGCCRQVGNMRFICEKLDGTPRLVAGPCWPFCLFITFPLIAGLSTLVAYFIIFKSGTPAWLSYIYIPLVGLTLAALGCVSCRNPGLLERVIDEEAGDGGWFWNEQVGSYRPPGALYCRECKVLIQDYDHLCPWTGTGIGSGNMFWFKTFVIFVNLLCYSSLALVAFVLLKGFK